MFRSMKKWLAVAAALAALTVPTLAFASDHDAQRVPQRDDKVLVGVRADAGPARMERDRDEWRVERDRGERGREHRRHEHKRHERDRRRGGGERRK